MMNGQWFGSTMVGNWWGDTITDTPTVTKTPSQFINNGGITIQNTNNIPKSVRDRIRRDDKDMMDILAMIGPLIR